MYDCEILALYNSMKRIAIYISLIFRYFDFLAACLSTMGVCRGECYYIANKSREKVNFIQLHYSSQTKIRFFSMYG